MDLRFLSYYYSPLKVIGLASMSSFTKTRESDPFSRMLVFEYASNGTLYEHRTYTMGKWPNSLGSDE
uniref:Serine-threonine/tyrosine-protein kinase catalytic domain-containing protein n=1 Tax=Aegilops tauschii subsp. strangulata TaxID=200361 RepID=A0A453PI23_AEGTS